MFLGTGLVIHEIRKPPRSSERGDGRSPLTDVARGNEGQLLAGPLNPLAAGAQPSAGQPTATAPSPIPPDEMPDPANPPRWTKPLAEPGPPVPPDPAVPPPMVVDPDRGRSPNARP